MTLKNTTYEGKEYVGFRLTSSKNINFPMITIVDTYGATSAIANIIFFIIIAICLFLCILTLIKTKACGSSDDKYAIPAQYAPLQSEIQIAPIQNNQNIPQ